MYRTKDIKKMTQTEALLLAIEKGYYITKEGLVFSKHKQLRPSKPGGYYKFCIRCCDGRIALPVHRLQAYQKYGDAIFEPGIVVRHLNGISLDNSWYNISIGTESDNRMDVPKLTRQRIAKYASKKYHKEDIEGWRALNDSGVSYREMEKLLNIPKSTFSYYLGKPDRKRQPVLFEE